MYIYVHVGQSWCHTHSASSERTTSSLDQDSLPVEVATHACSRSRGCTTARYAFSAPLYTLHNLVSDIQITCMELEISMELHDSLKEHLAFTRGTLDTLVFRTVGVKWHPTAIFTPRTRGHMHARILVVADVIAASYRVLVSSVRDVYAPINAYAYEQEEKPRKVAARQNTADGWLTYKQLPRARPAIHPLGFMQTVYTAPQVPTKPSQPYITTRQLTQV